jgi:hypothetical protein
VRITAFYKCGLFDGFFFSRVHVFHPQLAQTGSDLPAQGIDLSLSARQRRSAATPATEL